MPPEIQVFMDIEQQHGNEVKKKKGLARSQQLLGQMTLDEKIAQMRSCWMYELQTEGVLDVSKLSTLTKDGLGQVTRLSGASTYPPKQAAKIQNQVQRQLVEGTRLGIPAIIHEECCAGLIGLGASAFPQMIGLAGTFRPELAEKMTDLLRRQMVAIGARQGLAPVLDVGRDPRWGRIEETFGEDPLLIAEFGKHYIRGLQGNDLKDGVAATGKHFIGHSFSLGGLNCAPVMIGERTLWDVYMLPFQAAIQDAGLATMMNAYPELDGELVASSSRILTDILRGKLGFTGPVVSDYEAIQMLHTYHYSAETRLEAAKMAVEAGIDVELPTIQCFTDEFKEAVKRGDIAMEWIDRSVLNHLELKEKLGLFDQPYVDEGISVDLFEGAEQRELSRELARQSLVLLKNEGALPLPAKIQQLAVIGPNAASKRNLLCDYSYASMTSLWVHQKPVDSAFLHLDTNWIESNEVKVVSVLEGLQQALPEVEIRYEAGCDLTSGSSESIAAAVSAAAESDAVVLVLGDRSGLTPDCTCGETRDSSDLALPAVQVELAKAVAAAGKPVTLVLVNGRPVDLREIGPLMKAIVVAWIPGEEGGNAVADVLTGAYNPAGRLTVTWPRSVGQVPLFYNHKPSGSTSNWYLDYVNESTSPLYAFGHGLSYSNFEYSDLQISPKQAVKGETITVSCKVKNISGLAGDEVVQLYIQDQYGALPRPVQELKGFYRLGLKPGEERQLEFALPVDALAYYDMNINLQLEAGRFSVMVGRSSADIRLRGEFEVTGPHFSEVGSRVYHCPVVIR